MSFKWFFESNTDITHTISQSRRKALKVGLGLTAFTTMSPVWAKISKQPERKISLHNLHTGEKVQTVYWHEGQYDFDALGSINKVLRDHRNDEIYQMDPELMDLLYGLQNAVGGKSRALEVISGYRSPETNAKLRQNSNGVAKRSLHMQGKAIDIRMPGTNLDKLHQAALSLKAGGVGYYGKSNFIHVDTGRVRSWGK